MRGASPIELVAEMWQVAEPSEPRLQLLDRPLRKSSLVLTVSISYQPLLPPSSLENESFNLLNPKLIQANEYPGSLERRVCFIDDAQGKIKFPPPIAVLSSNCKKDPERVKDLQYLPSEKGGWQGCCPPRLTLLTDLIAHHRQLSSQALATLLPGHD